MLGFVPKATVAKRTAQRARRLGVHTVAPHRLHSLGAQGVALGGNEARLAQSDLALSPELQTGDAWSFKDRATAMRPLAAARTARSRGAQASGSVCKNHDNLALRGPSWL